MEDFHSCSSKSEIDLPIDPYPNSYDVVGSGFGVRRRHGCYVVKARARSFLYHQVFLIAILIMIFIDPMLLCTTILDPV